MTGRSTRAKRAALPLARDVVKAVALEHGACIRPVQLRETNLITGEVEQVLIPCGPEPSQGPYAIPAAPRRVSFRT